MDYDYDASLTLYDGVCKQAKELQKLTGSMFNDVKWILSSSGRYMFVRFAVGPNFYATGFLAKIHYGNEILNQKLVHRGNKVTVSTCFCKCSFVTDSAVMQKSM